MKRKRYVKLLMASGAYDRNSAAQQAKYVQELNGRYSKSFDNMSLMHEAIARISMAIDSLRIDVGKNEIVSMTYMGKRFLVVSNAEIRE